MNPIITIIIENFTRGFPEIVHGDKLYKCPRFFGVT